MTTSPHATCARCFHAADEHHSHGCGALYKNTANPCICAGFAELVTTEPVTVGSFLNTPGHVGATVRKIATQTFIADELLSRRAPLTDEELAAIRERRARNIEATATATTTLAAMAGLARAVLDLHRPTPGVYPECQGCDYAGYEAEPPRYPCRTVQLVADRANIALPDEWVTA